MSEVFPRIVAIDYDPAIYTGNDVKTWGGQFCSSLSGKHDNR